MIRWQITKGCSRLTPGCDNCPSYWEYEKGNKDYHPVFQRDRINEPRRFEKRDDVIVSPGSDIFHEAIRTSELLQILHTIQYCPQHSFEIGTKRIERVEALDWDWPDNVVMGVAVEQARYKWRIDALRNVKARRFVSFSPVLEDIGEVNLDGIHYAGAMLEDWGNKPRKGEQAWTDDLYDQIEAQGVVVLGQRWMYQSREAS